MFFSAESPAKISVTESIYQLIRCQVVNLFTLWLQDPDIVQYSMDKGILPSLVAASLEPSEDGTNINSVERHEVLIMEHLFEKRALTNLGQFVETISRASKLDLNKSSLHQSFLEKLIKPNKYSKQEINEKVKNTYSLQFLNSIEI